MEKYEIMLIISPELEKEEHEEVLGGLTSEIEKGEGSVSTILDWRRRRLAYEINKIHEGHYYLVYFTGKGSIIPELEHYFRVTDSVLRYMVVRVSEQEYAAAVEKAERDAAMAKAEAEKQVAEEVAAAEEPEASAEVSEEAAGEGESQEPAAEEAKVDAEEETPVEEESAEEPAAEETDEEK